MRCIFFHTAGHIPSSQAGHPSQHMLASIGLESESSMKSVTGTIRLSSVGAKTASVKLGEPEDFEAAIDVL